ncbi:DUF3152 domain-containing protein [Nonomuraea longicatena]|uniref:DUF3152 domain-containing protein n=1 Tax=Nonomuraea longicatena TaxID=83682 RepID=A0ABN1R3C5_9ACTN
MPRLPFVLLLVTTGCAAAVPIPAPPVPTFASAPPPAAAPRAGVTRKAEVSRRNVPVRVPWRASGRYALVAGDAAPPRGRGPVVRYTVEVERGLPFERRAFAEEVHSTLNDRRGWGRFRRVDGGPVRLSVALSSPALTDRQCLPLNTGGDLSCWNGRRSVINAVRWARGVPQYRGRLADYRDYVIGHEVGHGLGHGHRSCPGRDRLAPVMMQQSKSLDGCRPNPWPYPER